MSDYNPSRRESQPRGALGLAFRRSLLLVMILLLLSPSGPFLSHAGISPGSPTRDVPSSPFSATSVRLPRGSSVAPAPAAHQVGGPNTIFATINVGANPDAGAYDGTNGYLYFTNGGSGNVSVIDGASNHAISSIAAGNSPSGVAVDPVNGEVYVSNYGIYLGSGAVYSNVSVLYADSAVASVSVGAFPEGLAFDGTNQMIYVANAGSNNITVINGSTNSATATIPVGSYHTPVSVVYDSAQKELFVSEQATNSLTVISGTNNSILANVSVGNYPGPMAYDPVSNEVFVVNEGTNNISVVNCSDLTVVRSIPVGQSPDGIAYDSASGDLYVANFWSDNLTIVNASTGAMVTSVSVQHGPGGLTYDPSNHCVYVANYDADSISVIQTAGSCDLPQYSVTFVQSGFPSGSVWSVNFDVLKGESSNSVINFVAANGSYPFAIPNSAGYYATPRNGTVVVSGGNVSRTIVYALIPLTTYNVTFREAGLPVGSTWSVILGNLTSSSKSINLTFSGTLNGTHQYSVPELFLYVPQVPKGVVVVAGRDMRITVNFTALSTYEVIFDESGLPSGRLWTIEFAGATRNGTGSSIIFQEIPNGTYQFSVTSPSGYRSVPSTGPVAVFGRNSSQQLVFLVVVEPRYTVTFEEAGLTNATPWSVAFNGTISRSSSSSIHFSDVPNGTYSFDVTSVPGIVASPATGNLTVAGNDTLQRIIFAAQPSRGFSVRFDESGLPMGDAWAIVLDNRTMNSTNSTIFFAELAPGNYSYRVLSVVGFTAAPSASSISLTRGNTSVQIIFVAKSGQATGVGFPVGGVWILSAIILAAIALIGIGFMVGIRKRGRRVHVDEITVEEPAK